MTFAIARTPDCPHTAVQRPVIGWLPATRARRSLHARRPAHTVVSVVMFQTKLMRRPTVWLIEISVAGRTITRRVPGRRRGLFGLDGRGLRWPATLLRPST